MKRAGYGGAFAVAALVACLALALFAMRYGAGLLGSMSPATTTPSGAHVAPPPRVPPHGEKLYRSSAYAFSLFYPDTLVVNEYDEGSGASTITFQDAADGKGFQLYVLPYRETKISDARFHEDEPSGVREGVKAAQVGGAEAVSFYSTNPALGDTAEVWFIHDGYLYEVTTLKALAPWLAGIVQTWQFE